MPSTKLQRRTVLRGALGGSLVSMGLPTLEAMLNGNGTALASGRPIPRRLGIFFWGNGVKLDRWVPARTGKDWQPSPALAPLAKLKRYVSVVSGMQVLTGNERGHHAGCVGILSGAPMVPQPHPTSGYSSTFSAPSIDQVAADTLGRATMLRSLEVGVSRHVTHGEGTTLKYLSHRGPDNACPPEYDPRRVFARLFGDAGLPGTAGARGASALAAARADGHSVLDVVADDVADLRRRLGAADEVRLAQHLENVRELETRLVRRWPRRPGCRVRRDEDDRDPFAETDGKEPLAEINDAMARAVALALSCDLTRVFSFMFSGSVGNTRFWQVGEQTGHHSTTHDEPGEQPLVQAATVFTMKQFARLLEALRDTPEGAGNLLDHAAILATSDLSDGRKHITTDYPILVAGRAGGALRHPGVHHRSVGQENTSKVLLSLLRAVGLPLAAFGEKGGRVEDGCADIEA